MKGKYIKMGVESMLSNNIVNCGHNLGFFTNSFMFPF